MGGFNVYHKIKTLIEINLNRGEIKIRQIRKQLISDIYYVEKKGHLCSLLSLIGHLCT